MKKANYNFIRLELVKLDKLRNVDSLSNELQMLDLIIVSNKNNWVENQNYWIEKQNT